MALVLLLSLLAARDPRLDAAIEHYELANFGKARDALIELLEAPLSADDKSVARTYLAATYFALGDKASARLQLRDLARETPSGKPAPLAFPSGFNALADEVFASVEKQRALEGAPREPAPPRSTDASAAVAAEATPLVLVPAPSGPPPRALAFLPLGIGHFARGDIAHGGAWLFAQVALFATSAATYARLDSMKKADGENKGILSGDIGLSRRSEAEGLNAAASITFFAGVAAVIANVVVAYLTWPEGAAR